jgi:hypothetical protein
VRCDRLHAAFHGKEGVDGSSPSEGFLERRWKWCFYGASGGAPTISVGPMRLYKRRDLPRHKHGNRLMFHRDELDVFLREQG